MYVGPGKGEKRKTKEVDFGSFSCFVLYANTEWIALCVIVNGVANKGVINCAKEKCYIVTNFFPWPFSRQILGK